MSKKIFIAATQQDIGKTTVSLGLIYCLKQKFKKIGFIKPVGQRYFIEQGYKVDEDSILIEHVCHMQEVLKDMSPIAVEKGFTEKYIRRPQKKGLVKKIKQAYKKIAKKNELVIIEGTGHAGVGGVFDLSNAFVAKQLDSKVILISSGGIGRPIDEILLNKALFDKEGVEIMGVIVNKVLPSKYKKINELVSKGLSRKGLKVLGVLPYEQDLTKPMMIQIQEELKADVIYGSTYLDNVVEKIVIGAMEPHAALNYISDKSLVITPGDREDIILTALSMHLIHGTSGPSIAGLILTGGISPHPEVLKLIKCTDIPILLVKEDTYNVASRVHDMRIKIKPQDKTKTNLVIDLINKYVDMDAIARNL
jgi:dethiobiotin synthase